MSVFGYNIPFEFLKIMNKIWQRILMIVVKSFNTCKINVQIICQVLKKCLQQHKYDGTTRPFRICVLGVTYGQCYLQ